MNMEVALWELRAEHVIREHAGGHGELPADAFGFGEIEGEDIQPLLVTIDAQCDIQTCVTRTLCCPTQAAKAVYEMDRSRRVAALRGRVELLGQVHRPE